ncbi:S-layer homology domain-containing protein [Paenibacillus sp. CF384]|uniref:S-layer homology domain-containing protein n=1 Tax=Paenibacillus sp. CF384 TaxID=1884382 RepID=UPI0008974A6F|nr:S-layer homology domain-containing protein [Paenibacillus sp. CF384]SDW15137.1 S-layer homology domain-containing protein [Paenibacillus sp. CF384]
MRSKAIKSLAIIVSFIMLLLSITAGLGPVKTARAEAPFDLAATIEAASGYFQKSSSGVGSDWGAIGLTRAGKKIPDTYVQSLVNRVKYSEAEFDRVTELERTIMTLSAAGQDATNIAGFNLIEKLYSSNYMINQGINGPIFALIAMDSGHYEVPADAKWTRETLIDEIASRQNEDGGFSLSVGNHSDPDLTAMSLIALAPYAENATVKRLDLISDLTQWLSLKQSPNGGYIITSWGSTVDSSESVAQAIIGLTAYGVDPTGPDYTKNGITLIDKLMQFRMEDGTFTHTMDWPMSNGMATEQALQALDAYKLFLEGHGERLYDFSGTLPGLEHIPAAPVKIRVEGPEPNQSFFEGTANAATPLEALKSVSTTGSIQLGITSMWGMVFVAINDIAYNHYENDYGSWSFAIQRGNTWLTSSDGAMDEIPLKTADKLVFYYKADNTEMIDTIKVQPESGTSLNEDHAFDIVVNKMTMDWSSFTLVSAPAEGVNVDIVHEGETISTQTTNAQGTARFDGLTAGSYTVSVSKYVPKSGPDVVHKSMPLEVRSGIPPIELPLPNGVQPTITIPSDDRPYIIGIADSDSQKQIAITIPQQNQSLVMLNLPPNTDLPAIEAKKGNLTFSIAQGTQLISGDGSSIELLTSKNKSDSVLISRVNSLIPSGSTLNRLSEVITVGGGVGRVEFDSYLTLTFAGLKGNQAAYIQNGSPHVIQRFANDAEGLASGKEEYAFDSGDDLIVKTKHFTDYVAYTTQTVTIPSVPTPHATLSVDKLTINKGYVLQNTSFDLQPGDTAWSVLKRSLDAKGISYKSKYYASFGSVYVQAIDGDGEFDHGANSGWMYNVNGIYPGYGSSSYTLKDGDKVEWRYTTNLGKDLGASTSQWPDLPDDATDNEVPPNNEQDQNTDSSGSVNVDLNKHYSDAKQIAAWATSAIETATSKGFVKGTSGKLNPKSKITRAEFAKLMVEVLGLNVTAGAASQFTDVPQNKWFASYINTAYNSGIIMGFENRFNPNETITREQMAAIVVRALKLKQSSSSVTLQDWDQVSKWAQADVQTVSALQIMQGSANRFNPADSVTREMAIVVAMRAYAYKPDHNS